MELTPEEHTVLDSLVRESGKTGVTVVIKALNILAAIRKGEICLTTPSGEKLPNSLILF